jgi:hypothetical protein
VTKEREQFGPKSQSTVARGKVADAATISPPVARESPLGFFSFNAARRTIGGYETMNIIRKRQIEGGGKGDVGGQGGFVSDLFMIVA